MLTVGQNFSHYLIVSVIGHGGMGEVYLAEDLRLGRKVAIKVLSESVADNKERLHRFQQEAKAASALNHPNILTVHDFGAEDGRHFLATEYVDGQTLRAKMNSGPIPMIDALRLAEQMAFALSTAHQAGIIHRDIKPENIMVRRDGIIKILDFGLAKLSDLQNSSEFDPQTMTLVKTHPGVVMGTPSYMSPEQARGRETDERTDIWSLGVVTFEMLAGCQPFTGESFSHTIVALQEKDPPPLASFVKDFPAEIERILHKTLAKQVGRRYQTAEELLSDLKALRRHLDAEHRQGQGVVTINHHADLPTQKLAPAAPTARGFVADRSPRVAFGPLAFVSIALIVLGIAAYFFLLPGRTPITSVAVLPFENGTDDPELDYLSDGISESVIDKLSQLPQLKVIARSSSFKFRGPDVDLQKVASALGVQAVVTGRVVRRSDGLLIRVELNDVAENKQLWGEEFSRKLSDAVFVQQEIAQKVTENLKMKLSGADEQRLSKTDTVNPQAYELLLKGKFYDDKGGTENRKKATELYERAVAVDPSFALGFARLSAIYRRMAADSTVDPKEFIPKAEAAALKALQLDETLADAHVTMGNLHQYAWRWQDAEREYQRGIELSPNLGVAHRAYSLFLSLVGRHDEAIAEAKRARELDPVVLIANASVGYRLCFARRYDEAIEELQKLAQMDPEYDFTFVMLGYAYAGKGQYSDAIAAYLKAISLGDDTPSTQIYLGAAYARANEKEKATEILNSLKSRSLYVSPGELAVLYGALGETESAFRSLEQAYAAHDLQLQFLRSDPGFDPLRDDPRFDNLLQRIGLGDAQQSTK